MSTQVVFNSFLKQEGLPKPIMEHVFHKTRKWRFDYAWLDAKVALEVEGGIYGMGKKCPLCKQRKRKGHGTITGIKRDIEKYNSATIDGWRILRVEPNELLTQKTVKIIRATLNP